MIPNDFERVLVPTDWDYVPCKEKRASEFSHWALGVRVNIRNGIYNQQELNAIRLDLRETLRAVREAEKDWKNDEL